MRALVTGGTGFIGSNIALALLAQGEDVIVTGSLHEQHIPELSGKILYTGIIGIDWDAVGALDVVFHQGALSDTRILDTREMQRANVETTKAVFEQSYARGARTFVYASSTAVYGDVPPPYRESGTLNPLNPYAHAKHAQDIYAMQFADEHPDVRVVGLRYSNVYGPRENHKGSTATLIYQCANIMRTKNPTLFKHGEQKRDYIYVKDVVRANLSACSAKMNCIVNCGSGTATSFNRVVEILNSVLGVSRIPDYIDNPYEGRYQSYTECDMSYAEECLGCIPHYSIEDGIRDYYESGFLLKSA